MSQKPLEDIIDAWILQLSISGTDDEIAALPMLLGRHLQMVGRLAHEERDRIMAVVQNRTERHAQSDKVFKVVEEWYWQRQP